MDITSAVLMILLHMLSVDATSCPGILYGGFCFVYNASYPATTNWHEASSRCHEMGGSLPILSTKETHDTLLDYIIPQTNVKAVWLGAWNIASVWTWVRDGKQLAQQGCYKDNNWDLDLDTELVLTDLTPQACIQACRVQGFTYAATQSKSRCFCGNSFGKHGMETGENWCSVACSGDVTQTCGGWGRNMVYDVNGTVGQWIVPGHSDSYGNQLCAAIDSQQTGGYSDETCTTSMGYICSIDAHCPGDTPFFSVADRCIFIGQANITWYEAREDCVTKGGDLLVIDSSSFHQSLTNFLMENGDRERRWIGLTRAVWTWQTGEAVIYSNWTHESPALTDGCMLAKRSDGFMWSDANCETELASAVCQFEHSTAGKLITISVDTSTTYMARSTANDGMIANSTSSSELLSSSLPTSPWLPEDQAEPTLGDASSGDEGEILTTFEMVVAVSLFIIVIVLIFLLIAFVHYKTKDGQSKVSPSQTDVTPHNNNSTNNSSQATSRSDASLADFADESAGLVMRAQGLFTASSAAAPLAPQSHQPPSKIR